jgi:AhpD family alkylhydroperoxidase
MLDDADRAKIEKIIADRKSAHETLLKESTTYCEFTRLEKTAFAPASLPRKTKELIALGISIVTNCESCIEWHIHAALVEGSTREEIIEAIGVGIEMAGGPATILARFALKVLEYYGGKST